MGLILASDISPVQWGHLFEHLRGTCSPDGRRKGQRDARALDSHPRRRSAVGADGEACKACAGPDPAKGAARHEGAHAAQGLLALLLLWWHVLCS